MTELNIHKLPTADPALYAFEIIGKITKPEVEWMADILDQAFEDQETLDILIILRGYDGIEAGAVFDLKALKAQAQSTRHVRKYAVVGAPEWAETMINFFAPASPVAARTFKPENEDDAWAWVRASGE